MARLWVDVDVFMDSAVAAPKTITAITKATEGVVSAAAHGYSTGDYVLIKAQGMSELDERVFRVVSVDAGQFKLEGEDTTNYPDFSSGTAQKITYGTTLTELTSVNASGGEPEMKDTTKLKSRNKSSMPGLTSASEYSFEAHWAPEDAGMKAANTASKSKAQKAFMIVFADGARVCFYGYISCTMQPGGTTGDVVKTPIKITAQGALTSYAS